MNPIAQPNQNYPYNGQNNIPYPNGMVPPNIGQIPNDRNVRVKTDKENLKHHENVITKPPPTNESNDSQQEIQEENKNTSKAVDTEK
jgi:hypothetical protein